MSNIRELKPHAATNATTISKLEEALAMAKEGRLIEVCLVGCLSTRGIFTSTSSSEDIYRLIGAMEQLKHELLNDKMLGND
ncbi:hypothetical protein [Methylobacterium sp. GXF4]|uniref:hypothetical protein n=1 Tax=Methylobacterium sp. GXF4 TaxID=1096546 RepID=UPI000FFE8B35|nr:hypothetical protein [Methylobacterium sp. GXF4]